MRRCDITASRDHEGPVESAAEAPMNNKIRPNTHYSPIYWSCCSYMIILARPGVPVAMGLPTVHEETSHGPPMKPTVRPSNGV